ncbi:MAG: SPFH domain-containing protein [Patescibacteria group bacterium]
MNLDEIKPIGRNQMNYSSMLKFALLWLFVLCEMILLWVMRPIDVSDMLIIGSTIIAAAILVMNMIRVEMVKPTEIWFIVSFGGLIAVKHPGWRIYFPWWEERIVQSTELFSLNVRDVKADLQYTVVGSDGKAIKTPVKVVAKEISLNLRFQTKGNLIRNAERFLQVKQNLIGGAEETKARELVDDLIRRLFQKIVLDINVEFENLLAIDWLENSRLMREGLLNPTTDEIDIQNQWGIEILDVLIEDVNLDPEVEESLKAVVVEHQKRQAALVDIQASIEVARRKEELSALEGQAQVKALEKEAEALGKLGVTGAELARFKLEQLKWQALAAWGKGGQGNVNLIDPAKLFNL